MTETPARHYAELLQPPTAIARRCPHTTQVLDASACSLCSGITVKRHGVRGLTTDEVIASVRANLDKPQPKQNPLATRDRDTARANVRRARAAKQERQLAEPIDLGPRAQHGTEYGYRKHCRCTPCRDAHAAKARGDKPAVVTKQPTHGTRYAYRARGCRCELCLAWKSGANRAYDDRRKQRDQEAA